VLILCYGATRKRGFWVKAPDLLAELSKLTREEFRAFIRYGAFTGFTEQDIEHACAADSRKMQLFNEGFRLIEKARRLERRRGQ
jgi:hypothetical protein